MSSTKLKDLSRAIPATGRDQNVKGGQGVIVTGPRKLDAATAVRGGQGVIPERR